MVIKQFVDYAIFELGKTVLVGENGKCGQLL